MKKQTKKTGNKQNAGNRSLWQKLNNPRNRRRANLIFWGIILFPFASILLLLLLISVGAFGKLPSFEELENPNSNIATQVISSDGKQIGSYYIENRSFVDYNELSPNLVAALVATEDARFYGHSGIDFIGLARVAIKTMILQDRGQGGGSTISQQLSKNLYPRDTIQSGALAKGGRLVVSKLKEWITATMLEYNYTKEEIVAMYLNTVFYGSNAFGIKSASETFFGKQPSDLSIEEAAMLVGVVNAPTRYSPIRNPENALNRRNLVIGRMSTAGYLSKDESTTLKAKPIELDYNPISHNDGLAPYFREMVRLYMTASEPVRKNYSSDWNYEVDVKRWKTDPLYGWCNKNTKADGTNYNLYRDGLKIYTTVNSKMQRYAEEAVQEHMSGTVQAQFNREAKARKTPFVRSPGISTKDIDNILERSIIQSERGWAMRQAGIKREDIIAKFNQPIDMTIFSYKGDIDTVMTPRDSLIYYKSFMRTGFVAVEPTSGYVLAYVGGPSFRHFKYDMARQGTRQVGSAIKPFVYTFAIDFLGYNPCTMVPNLPVTIDIGGGKTWTPKEASRIIYDGILHPLRWGLANSRNNYSAWIMEKSSPQAVTDLIHRMGISSWIDPVYSLCAGTPEISVYEMAGAFATFVNRGVHTEPLFVTRIEDKQGNVLASFSPTTQDAISEQTAYTMLGMLQNNIISGTGGRLKWQYNMTGDVGGKTGTTNEQVDAWFMGVTPRIVAGTWVGGEDAITRLTGVADGSRIALPIFGEFMKRVYADKSLGIGVDDKFLPPIGAITYNCSDEDETRKAQQRTVQEEEFFD